MKRVIDISEEVLENLYKGKRVEGAMRCNELTGEVTFRAYRRKSRSGMHRDRLVCQLENGWLKESPTRLKFYNSVKKDLGIPMTQVVMERELKTAVHELEIERILENY